MQKKISSFFKPSPSPKVPIANHHTEEDDEAEEADLCDALEIPIHVSVTYTRRSSKPSQQSGGWNYGTKEGVEAEPVGSISLGSSMASTSCHGKLNKKRSYAQYHLEFGQSNFLLHTCSGCGMTYTCGDETDEKLHKMHHKNYHEGISFKGWRNKCEIPMYCTTGQRIVLVLDEDPPFQKRKVQQVLQLMEMDLSLSKEWLLHRLCKVFLFISRCRIVACLVAEPITAPHHVIPIKIGSFTSKNRKALATVLHFGDATFYRESIKKPSSKTIDDGPFDDVVLLCSEESENATCDIRAIWVVSSLRRHGIATSVVGCNKDTFLS